MAKIGVFGGFGPNPGFRGFPGISRGNSGEIPGRFPGPGIWEFLGKDLGKFRTSPSHFSRSILENTHLLLILHLHISASSVTMLLCDTLRYILFDSEYTTEEY